MPVLPDNKWHLIKVKRTRKDHRPPVQSSLGAPVKGVALPKPDFSDADTCVAGLKKRMLLLPPPIDKDRFVQFKRFVVNWLEKHMTPLCATSDVSVPNWLKHSSYPLWRCEQLEKLYEDRQGKLRTKDFEVSSFIKDEPYPEFKHARWINSRSDMFKCTVGPIFRLIECELFKKPQFIKKVPIAERPQYIYDKLYSPGAKYFEGDYTSFEAHFTDKMLEIEFLLYEYMSRHVSGGKEWYKTVRDTLSGDNVCKSRNVRVEVEATRMSGEMCTSLGNSFLNAMVLMFLFDNPELDTVVEGDDSLTAFHDYCPNADDFKSLGLTIKCNTRQTLNDASFCGLIFDTKDMINVTDPIKLLASFGWSGKSYVRARRGRRMCLLRCKALSYLHQYPGCPIVQSLALYGLRTTKSFDVRGFVEKDRYLSGWERGRLRDAIAGHPVARPVPHATRVLVNDIYGISIGQQLEIENYLDSLDHLTELDGPIGNLTFPECWKKYYQDYHEIVDRTKRDLDFPEFLYPTLESET